MAEIKKDTLHPDGQPEVDIYPKTSVDQVEGLSTELDNKMNSVNSEKSILVAPVSGNTPSTVHYTSVRTVGSIPIRDDNMTFKVGSPVDYRDVANKEYVDGVKKYVDGIVKKLYVHRVTITYQNGNNIRNFKYNIITTSSASITNVYGLSRYIENQLALYEGSETDYGDEFGCAGLSLNSYGQVIIKAFYVYMNQPVELVIYSKTIDIDDFSVTDNVSALT